MSESRLLSSARRAPGSSGESCGNDAAAWLPCSWDLHVVPSLALEVSGHQCMLPSPQGRPPRRRGVGTAVGLPGPPVRSLGALKREGDPDPSHSGLCLPPPMPTASLRNAFLPVSLLIHSTLFMPSLSFPVWWSPRPRHPQPNLNPTSWASSLQVRRKTRLLQASHTHCLSPSGSVLASTTSDGPRPVCTSPLPAGPQTPAICALLTRLCKHTKNANHRAGWLPAPCPGFQDNCICSPSDFCLLSNSQQL